MPRHLKTRIQNRLRGIIDHYVSLPPISAPRTRGVRYFVPIACYEAYWGSMNTVKEGSHYKKHIVVRRMDEKPMFFSKIPGNNWVLITDKNIYYLP